MRLLSPCDQSGRPMSHESARGMARFMVLKLAGLGLCIAYPELALWRLRVVFEK